MADGCDCAGYRPLELVRAAINERIKESLGLRKRLKQVAEHAGKEHVLFRCPACQQLWQRSLAWNWGNKEYLFAVPEIGVEAWQEEPYVQPDELLIAGAMIGRYLQQQQWEEGEAGCRKEGCRKEGCGKRAVKGAGLCREHQLANLQEVKLLPAFPKGRWFGPYVALRSGRINEHE